MVGWCWWGSPLPPCITLLHMRVLAAHLQCWIGPLSPVYDFLTPHTHGTPLLLSCGSGSAWRLVRNFPWKPSRFSIQPACLPPLTGFFYLYCPEDQQLSNVDHFTYWGWDVSGFYKLHYFFNCSKFSSIGSRSNHYCFIFSSLSSMSMGEMIPW